MVTIVTEVTMAMIVTLVECSENDFKDIPNYALPIILSYISTITEKSLCDGILTYMILRS